MSVRSPLALPPRRPTVLHIPYNASDMLVINDFARLVTFSCAACLGKFGNCYSAKIPSGLGFFFFVLVFVFVRLPPPLPIYNRSIVIKRALLFRSRGHSMCSLFRR